MQHTLTIGNLSKFLWKNLRKATAWKTMRRKEDSKIEFEDMYWVDVAEDMFQWNAILNAGWIFVSQRRRCNFLVNLATLNLWENTFLLRLISCEDRKIFRFIKFIWLFRRNVFHVIKLTWNITTITLYLTTKLATSSDPVSRGVLQYCYTISL
jgi:hypothetical protein